MGATYFIINFQFKCGGLNHSLHTNSVLILLNYIEEFFNNIIKSSKSVINFVSSVDSGADRRSSVNSGGVKV